MSFFKAHFGKLTAQRVLAAIAVLALLYFAAGGAFLHEHKAGRIDTPCHVCQAFHIPALAASAGPKLDSPQFQFGRVANSTVASPDNSHTFPHAGRAPPTA